MRPYLARYSPLRCGTVVTAGASPSEYDVLNKLPSPWKENATNLIAKDPKGLSGPELTGAKTMLYMFAGVPSTSPDFSTFQDASKVLLRFLHEAEPTNPNFGIDPSGPVLMASDLSSPGLKGSTADKDKPAGTPPDTPTQPENPPSIWNSNITKGVAIAGVALLAGVAIAKMA